MKDTTYDISEIYNNEGREWARYVVTSRAIPHIIDGLKPSQRFYLYSSLMNSRTQRKKVAAIAGICSEYGFNHGEASLMSVGQLMGADWANNIQLVEGEGSFGTRLVQEAGAPRYIFTKLHKNFDKYIKDIELSPEHYDPEHAPPKFYVPSIPLVLANGVKGIGTGFATNILPRDPEDISNACVEYLNTGKISKRLRIKFPHFKGKVKLHVDGRWYGYGVMEKKSPTKLLIHDIPYGYDRESYVKILDKLELNDDIVKYEDISSGDGFSFEVTLKRGDKRDEMQLIRLLKLEKTYSENLTVVTVDDTIKTYDDERELVKDFCDWRLEFLNKRIEKNKSELSELLVFLKHKLRFVQDVASGEISFHKKTKAQIVDEITERYSEDLPSKDHLDRLLSLQLYSLTEDMVAKLKSEISKLEKDYEYWEATNTKDQFLNDLEEL